MASFARLSRDRYPFTKSKPREPTRILPRARAMIQDPLVSKILTLPNELILEIIDSGNFTQTRLHSIRLVHRSWADLLASRCLHTITIPLEVLESVDYLKHQYNRLHNLLLCPRLSRLRKYVRAIRINARETSNSDIQESAVYCLFRSCLSNLHEVYIDATITKPDCMIWWNVKAVLKTALSPMRPIGTRIRLTPKLAGHPMFNLNVKQIHINLDIVNSMVNKLDLDCLPDNIRSLKITVQKRVGTDITAKLENNVLSKFLKRSTNLTSLSIHVHNFTLGNIIGRVNLKNPDVWSRITHLDMRTAGSPILGSRLLEIFPNIKELAIDNYEDIDDEDGQCWDRLLAQNHPLKTICAMPTSSLLGYLKSPYANCLTVLDIDLDAMMYNINANFANLDKLGKQLWVEVIPKLRNTMVDLSVTERRYTYWLETSVKEGQFIRRVGAWCPADPSYPQLDLPMLEKLRCSVIYNTPGKFDVFTKKIEGCSRLHKLEILAVVLEMPILDDVDDEKLKDLWEDTENSSREEVEKGKWAEYLKGLKEIKLLVYKLWQEIGEAKEIKTLLDTHLAVETMNIPFVSMEESHWVMKFVHLVGGWRPITSAKGGTRMLRNFRKFFE